MNIKTLIIMTKYYKNNNDYANYEMIIKRNDIDFFNFIRNTGLRFECINNSNLELMHKCILYSDLLIKEISNYFESIDKTVVSKIFGYRLIGANDIQILEKIKTCKKEDLVILLLILSTDELQEQFLGKFDNILDDLRVIVGFKKDEMKAKYLKDPRYKNYTAVIISAMQNGIEYAKKQK